MSVLAEEISLSKRDLDDLERRLRRLGRIDASSARRSGRIFATSLVSLDVLSKRCGALPPRNTVTRNRLHRSCAGDFGIFFYCIFNNFHVIGAPGERRAA